MSPDDPRHGTEAGHQAHRREGEPSCAACCEGRLRANKRRKLYGSRKVPALGSQRRVQALQALGWSRRTIAREIGYANHGSISYLMTARTMLPETAARIAEVYERMSMTVPQGSGATRARTWARRYGWAPPLAWDDIDNPTERPKGMQLRGAA